MTQLTSDERYAEVAARDARDQYDARFRKSQRDSLKAMVTILVVVAALVVGAWIWNTLGWGWIVAAAVAAVLGYICWIIWTAINYMLSELE